MSEKPLEYLKRTCLICGCHTNQTINIYEPRSGPNIIQLIQAKFKFQPLNEDKYLCFSCNNWLINWHSLQALNSNDAESPSGTYRSHLNNMVSEKGSGASKHNSVCLRPERPVAHIRPQQLEMEIDGQTELHQSSAGNATAPPAHLLAASKRHGHYFSKRTFLNKCHRFKKNHYRYKKSMQTCSMCSRSIVLRFAVGANTMKKIATSTTLSPSSSSSSSSVKCRKCREISMWRSVYLKNSLREKRRQEQLKHLKHTGKRFNNIIINKPTNLVNPKRSHNVVVSTDLSSNNNNSNVSANSPLGTSYQSHKYQRPLVDGKIVSMLRRLGTTLSRESTSTCTDEVIVTSSSSSLPQIMSPAKKRPQFTRQLEDDEILIDFNTAITEVLPAAMQTHKNSAELSLAHTKGQPIRRKLTYQVTPSPITGRPCSQNNNENADAEGRNGEIPEDICHIFPKGLSVSLIAGDSSRSSCG